MKRPRIAALALLCVLSGSGWLIEQFYPREIGFPFAGFIHFAVIAAFAVVVWFAAGRAKLPLAKASGIVLAGIGVFALPAIMLAVALGAVSEFTSVAVFCAIPLITVLLLGTFDWTGLPAAGPRSLLTCALGLGGALLVVPAQLPGTARGWIYLCLVAVSCSIVAFAGIVMHRLLQGTSVATAMALASAGCAVALGAWGLIGGWPAMGLHSVGLECLRCLLFDLPAMWLTVWLIRELNPGKLSARFLLVPLISAVEAYAAMGGGGGVQAGLGMILMAGSGVLLVKDEGRDEEQDASSLHLR